jgi:RimJ/RimL family protein N-acetyltransferase
VHAPRRLLTARLDLRAPDVDQDLDGMFALLSGPAQWEHAPDSRHGDRQTTRDWIRRAAARWDSDGLSYWTIRSRSSAEIIGVGGAQRQSTGAWNLLWRIDTRHQRQGLATELGSTAISKALETDASVPIIAWIVGHNTGSIAVAERLELRNNGLRRDPSDGSVRFAYADRTLDAAYGEPFVGSEGD